jgi:hypothetical protein
VPVTHQGNAFLEPESEQAGRHRLVPERALGQAHENWFEIVLPEI